MKTYNQFITELNKFEAAMKAGKLSVKALKRVFADPKTGAFKINTTKVTNPLANAMFKKQGLKKRVKPRSTFEDGYVALKLANAAYKSLKLKKTIKI